MVFWFFWPHREACGILAPRPGIEAVPAAVEVWSLNPWTTREVHTMLFVSILRNDASPVDHGEEYTGPPLAWGCSTSGGFHFPKKCPILFCGPPLFQNRQRKLQLQEQGQCFSSHPDTESDHSRKETMKPSRKLPWFHRRVKFLSGEGQFVKVPRVLVPGMYLCVTSLLVKQWQKDSPHHLHAILKTP